MSLGTVPAIVLDGEAMLQIIRTVLWAGIRIGGLVMVAPLFGTRAVPRRVKTFWVLALAFAMAPLSGTPPPLPGIDPLSIALVARELAIGVLMGLVLRLAFEAGAVAGELVSQGTGLGFAVMADPLRGTNAGVVGQWFYLAFSLVFLAMDGHLAVVGLLADSWRAVPLNSDFSLDVQHLAVVPQFAATMFQLGLQVALPVMLAMLAINIAFGVLSRAAPSLNPIQLGLPASVLIGLWLMAYVFVELEGPLRTLYEVAFAEAARVVGAGR